MMDILCPKHVEHRRSEKNWINRDIKLVSYSSTITMVHGPMYIRYLVRLNEKNIGFLYRNWAFGEITR